MLSKTWNQRILMSSVFISLVLLTACGSAASTSTPTATATPKVAHASQSPAQMLAGLKAKGLPVGASFTFDETSDQNHLLGRPGQYIAKANFIDTRLQTNDAGNAISVRDGGSIELFANVVDAGNRARYVEAIAKSASLFAEYDYLDGVALLRISTDLTPTQAALYQTALVALP